MIPTIMLGSTGREGARWDSVDDPHWANVVVLLRMEGSDGGTTFTDSGPLGLTMDRTGTHNNSITQVKSGTTSCKCGGTGRLRYLNTAATQLAGDFTAEGWVYWDDTPNNVSYLFGFKVSSSAGLFRDKFAATPHALTWRTNGGVETSGSTAITDDAWHHLVVQRSGSTVEWGLDGVSQGTVTDSATYSVSGEYTYITGAQDGGGDLGVPGGKDYADIVRVTKNVARYTFPFTPPFDY